LSRNAVQALLEEWERSRRQVVALLPRIRASELEGGDPLDETRARGVLVHVLRAGYGYATWICEVLGFPVPERRIDVKTLAGRADFERAFDDLAEYFPRAMQPLLDTHLEDPSTGRPPPHFPSRWGEEYGVEQMLEHAICHNLRHRRQLERWPVFD
jgi:hypothetical protein